MKVKSLGGGAGIIVLAWGCSSNVQIGHGDPGGQPGQGGSNVGGGGGLSPGGESSSGGSMAGSLGSGGSVIGGMGGMGGKGGTGGSTGFPPDPPQQTANKLDLLFVVDNSISMADSQTLLAQSVGSFLRRLENPLCVEPNGTPSATQPATPAENCAGSAQREFSPVRDMHIGVITSSLGTRGGQVCADVNGDDRAQLLPSVRPGLNSYNGAGFLKWDPDATATPAGETDLNVVASDLTAHIAAAGAVGCGFEHTLEAWYQFLIEPLPTTTITQVNSISTPMGVNETVLEQREAFLRADSAVAIVVLSDENDCSIVDNSMGWLVGLVTNGGPFTMPRSTDACKTDVNSPCCRSCADARPTLAGCTTVGLQTNDPECMKNNGNLDNGAGSYEDQINMRCFEQKRRFGFDLLFPIERYTAGLTSKTVTDREGNVVANPLYSTTRNPSLISFALIAGVPWQAISADAQGNDVSYLTPAELTAQGRWAQILGDPQNGVPPTDPFLQETPNERQGASPIVGGATIVPSSSQDPTANPINGHEQTNVANDDLQYSCTFELPVPSVCSDDFSCDCAPGTEARNRPICQPPAGGPAGNTQYYGKAYPPTRQLALARSLGEQAVLGSICSRNTADAVAPDYAYSAEFNSLARRLGVMLVE